MSNYLALLIQKYATRGVVLDTNLLVLYLVGAYKPAYVPQFKKTTKYLEEDFVALQRLLKHFRKIVITPQILAELSNLTFRMQEPHFKKYFVSMVKLLDEMREESTEKKTLLHSRLLVNIGFTDLSILECAKSNQFLVLTDDFRLTNFLTNSRVDFLNLNHLRTATWLEPA